MLYTILCSEYRYGNLKALYMVTRQKMGPLAELLALNFVWLTCIKLWYDALLQKVFKTCFY